MAASAVPHPTVVLDVVGLTGKLIGPETPRLAAFARAGVQVPLRTVTPAVTCTVQSTLLTGALPRDHGIVANGWYFRDLAQVWLWRQSNQLVQGEKVWEAARRRDPRFTCAKLFWWYNMYASVDWSVTPRPVYLADGGKIFDIYGAPADLPARLKDALGEFPFFTFWGPKAGIACSEWIAEASKLVFDWHRPSLTLVYLPHLDYNLQRLGPADPAIREDLKAIDGICGRLIDHFQAAGARVVVLSEYGITDVREPVHINRILREQGWIAVRPELGLETLDAGASEAFAVADHQLAHVYVRDPARVAEVKRVLEHTQGIERVLDAAGKAEYGLDHERSGELIAIAEPDRWFTYYYWLDDTLAPDFARTVDIHRKPGYDPAELFVDPKLRLPLLKVAWTLLKKQLGFRYLMDVIPLDAGLVKGSHGRITDDPLDGPVFISSEKALVRGESVAATDVKELLLRHLYAP
ncbi:MAG: alkaline phosphatase family protein [Acidobacteriia bacterium]|nr:alkaline phosphatase family protein [Terriglobia bacterium]